MASKLESRRPRVVIVGAGFGGLFAAQALARAAADVTIIDRHNYHLFQPLLYQVATAGLPPSDIAWPVRSILRRQRNTTVLLGEVTSVDVERPMRTIREPVAAIRLPGARDWLDAFVFRPRAVAGHRAGPEEHRRRYVHPQKNPAGVRGRRGRARPGRASAAAALRDRRRGSRPASSSRARSRSSPATRSRPISAASIRAVHGSRSSRPGRACSPRSRNGSPLMHSERSSSSASRCGSTPQSPTATSAESRSATSASSRARSSGPRASRRRRRASWLGAEVDRAGRVEGARRPVDPGRPERLRDRRRGARRNAEWRTRAGRCAGRETAGPLRRQAHHGPHRGKRRTEAVRLSQSGQPRHDRPQARNHRVPVYHAARLACVVDMGHRAHLLSRRRAEPVADLDTVALGIPHVRPRCAPDHGLGARGLRAASSSATP